MDELLKFANSDDPHKWLIGAIFLLLGLTHMLLKYLISSKLVIQEKHSEDIQELKGDIKSLIERVEELERSNSTHHKHKNSNTNV